MLYYNITSAKMVCASRFPDGHGRRRERQRGRWKKANSAQGPHIGHPGGGPPPAFKATAPTEEPIRLSCGAYAIARQHKQKGRQLELPPPVFLVIPRSDSSAVARRAKAEATRQSVFPRIEAWIGLLR